MNKEYPKIETVYMREQFGDNRLIEGEYRNPLVEFLAHNEWEATEKIDGTNIRVYWDGHKVEFAGRTDRAQIPNHLLEYLENTFGGEKMEEVFEQMFGEKEVILYGEGYGPKIQNGGAYRKDVSFILFDVLIDGIWLDYDSMWKISVALGIDIVPVVCEGTIDELIDYVRVPRQSRIGAAQMEGVVARPKQTILDKRGRRIVVKIKYCDFCDVDKKGN